MFTRPRLEIRAKEFQQMVEDFTLNHRDFTAFSSTKLDHIFHFYCPQFKGFMYSQYDTAREMVIFVGKPDIDKGWFEGRGITDVKVEGLERPLEVKLITKSSV